MTNKSLESIVKKHNISSSEELNKILTSLSKNKPSSLSSHDHYFSDKHVKIGVVSDNHFGNKCTDKIFLNKLYSAFKKDKVEAVYNVGDVIDGFYGNRPGHVYELYAIGASAQVDDVVKDYPKINGINTYFISGNHPINSYPGINTSEMIALKRPDMKYIGDMEARINLSKDIKMDLVHPQDGSSYALSYKTQKMIDAMQGGNKPNIMLVGHYHKAEQLFYRNIHAYQVGTTENQTLFMKGKQLAAHKCGWILDIYMNKSSIDKIVSTLIPDY